MATANQSQTRQRLLVLAGVVLGLGLVVILLWLLAGGGAEEVLDQTSPVETGLENPGHDQPAVDPFGRELDHLQELFDNPGFSAEQKAGFWTSFIIGLNLPPTQCQDLPVGDAHFLSRLASLVESGGLSPGVTAILTEMVAIGQKYDLADYNLWLQNPGAVEEVSVAFVKHKALFSDIGDRTEICLYDDIEINSSRVVPII